MKRVLAVIVALMLIAAFAVPAFATYEESDKSVSIPKVEAGSIVIDAEKDAAYDQCTVIPLDEQNLENWADSPANSTGKAWALWDGSYVYLYVEIYDDDIDYTNANPEQTWNRESIGVIMDFDYNRTPEDEYNYAADGDHICYVNLSGDGVLVTYHMYADTEPLYDLIRYQTKDGSNTGTIVYEVAMPLPTTAVTISDGMKIGFEICVPNASGGTRVGVVSWSEHGQDMYHYTYCCGTAELAASAGSTGTVEITDPVTTDTPTDSTNPTTADISAIFYALASLSAVGGVALIGKKK